MGTRRRATALVATTAAFLLVTLGASASGNPAAPDPDTAQMVLASKDFSASSIYLDRHLAPSYPVVSEYERAFAGVRLGSQRVFEIVTVVELLPDAAITSLGFDQLRSILNTPSGRKQIANQFASTFARGSGGRIKIKSVSVGAPVTIAAGQAAFRIPVVMKTSRGHLSLPIAAFRLDRGFGIDVFAGYPGRTVTASIVETVVRRSVAHLQTAFTVKNAVVPSIGGAAQQGQTLTANPGVWSGAPNAFTYQWNRCNSTGTACTPIAGATGPTYLVGTADSGSTVQVSVTGANTVSSTSATSTATAAVP